MTNFSKITEIAEHLETAANDMEELGEIAAALKLANAALALHEFSKELTVEQAQAEYEPGAFKVPGLWTNTLRDYLVPATGRHPVTEPAPEEIEDMR